jgi:enterochelin esterase-like enzyme
MSTGTTVTTHHHILSSSHLDREVIIDFFVAGDTALDDTTLLILNDGQLMDELGLSTLMQTHFEKTGRVDFCCLAVHAGVERKMEYGTAHQADYQGFGAKAGLYTKFVMEELLPFIRKEYDVHSFRDKMFGGFSLGGLSALDIVWNNPTEFSCAGIFSGSLWWRVRGLKNGYVEERDRIMHAQIRDGGFYPWLRFFFETGTQDETADRNGNGIIDSIDDTLDLIDELVKKGYDRQSAICYLELPDGRHDVATWASAMPVFLEWAFG